jgi:hypothetical protein
MKKIFLIGISFLAVAFLACGDDNSTGNSENNGEVVGPDGKVIPDSILYSDSLYSWYLEQFDKEHPDNAAVAPGTGKVSAEKVILRLQEENLPFLLRIGASPEQAEGLIEKAYRILKEDDDREILAKAYELYLKEKSPSKEKGVPAEKEEADLRNAPDHDSIPDGMLSDSEEW